MRDDQIALQLYTVRGAMADDLPATLRAVAAAGYRAVELAGLPPTDPAVLAGLLDAAGLRPVAAHESLESLRGGVDAVADRLERLGCNRVIVPSLPDADRASVDALRRVAAELGELAERLAARGLRLGYHNHAFEWDAVDGTTTWEVLTHNLPPDVELEVDVHWATIAGQDAAALIRGHASRVRLLHMKDVDRGPARWDAPAGAGTLPWPDIVSAGAEAAVEWYVVEQDEPRRPLEDVASAYRFLAGLTERATA